jgi:hypothetical protein
MFLWAQLLARPANAEYGIDAFKSEMLDAMSVAFQVGVDAGSVCVGVWGGACARV